MYILYVLVESYGNFKIAKYIFLVTVLLNMTK